MIRLTLDQLSPDPRTALVEVPLVVGGTQQGSARVMLRECPRLLWVERWSTYDAARVALSAETTPETVGAFLAAQTALLGDMIVDHRCEDFAAPYGGTEQEARALELLGYTPEERGAALERGSVLKRFESEEREYRGQRWRGAAASLIEFYRRLAPGGTYVDQILLACVYFQTKGVAPSVVDLLPKKLRPQEGAAASPLPTPSA